MESFFNNGGQTTCLVDVCCQL